MTICGCRVSVEHVGRSKFQSKAAQFCSLTLMFLTKIGETKQDILQN